ncbi:MAG: L,D-transpeptidase family protein [Methylobacterium sp.]|uniref:L,D-transpeptidase family protein n=1 Tax=unclassified Methylobacterium TaxID=2615210 RepID=UPI0011CCD00F|nr:MULTISPECIES: L,D-transpeptidase family protein [unclassified Methylobacterium]MDO9426451.1 L,D-transpeptidase family protein [Methylobacterium sp.]TXM79062.1 L,D-transpeptidase family protein [Methylobacterium sp. WL69]
MAVRPSALRPYVIAGLAALTISLGACQDGSTGGGVPLRALAPVPQKTLALMTQKGMAQNDPILIRAYKKEAEMEVWKRGAGGQYALLKTFPICRWSGQLGPKTKQGDRQAPEGFYTVTPGQMNPNSSYYLSFDTGYPNAYDRANNRSGNYIMVHGTCSSAGCFAMTDESMGEIYALARDSFAGGQRAFQFQSYPFRMTASNVAKFRNDPNAPFWKNLKEGSDYFEALREEPKVGLCGTRYVFGGSDAAAGSCTPRVEPQVAEKRDRDNREIAELVAKGTPATRVVYEDGSQNPVFRPQAPSSTLAFANLVKSEEPEQPYDPKDYARHHLGEVSRPETIAAAREVEVDAKGRPVMLAAADAPIPTKAAAAQAGRKGAPARTTLMAKVEPVVQPLAEPAATPQKPARVMVADADGDPAAYKKLLGNLFSNGPAPATPAADAATIPPAVAADPVPTKLTPKAPAKVAHSGQIHAATTQPAKGKPGTVAAVDEKAAKPAAKPPAPATKAAAAKD